MSKKNSPQELYSVSKTFLWFAVASVLLTISLAMIIWKDYDRPWKKYQKQFNALKVQKAQEDLKAAKSSDVLAQLKDLESQKTQAQKEFDAHKQNHEKLQKQIADINYQASKIRDQYQTLKQQQDSYRYYMEEYAAHPNEGDTASYRKKYEALVPRTNSLQSQLETLESNKEALVATQNQANQKLKDLDKSIRKASEDISRAQGRIDSAKPSLVKDVLNAPMLDFMAPTLKVRQIVLDELYDDFHFAKVSKVDRCTTCHLGIDQKGFENAPQPFRTHPNLDLYLGSSSAHPIEKIGCTTCHGGNGHSVDFTYAAHTPKDEKQEHVWKKQHGWYELEKWDAKMLPAQHIQASCTQCHTQVVDVPKADKLNEGRKLAVENGCLNCHALEAHPVDYKLGPSLLNVNGKLSKNFIQKWLQDPTKFRADTKMPKVFHLSNQQSAADIKNDNAAILAIAEYLSANSQEFNAISSGKSGDAARGEELVKAVGCTGCHSVAGVSINHYGPSLEGLGSKVNASWLQDWLKNPKHYSPNTRMPSLRLSDQEAADIAAYLLTSKNEAFDAMESVKVDEADVKALLLESLKGSMREEQAKTYVDDLSAQQRLVELGKKTITHQGCYTCHSIQGFEGIKPIGADLSNEGHKDIHQFDFGFIDIAHTRYDYISQKLRDPRIFDHGKVKSYYEKLKMPQFKFTNEQIDSLTTFILSNTHQKAPLQTRDNLDLKRTSIEQGRAIAEKYHCLGCHSMDGKIGALRKDAEDLGSMPPSIEGEGAKVQEKWLHAFLAHPTTIRPWLSYRMPSFDMSDSELTGLVHYFSYLSHEDISYNGVALSDTTDDELTQGAHLFEMLQCAKCHKTDSEAKEAASMGTSFLAPDLVLTKHRLKPTWVVKWLNDPQSLDAGTMMPAFFSEGQSAITDIYDGDAAKQIKAITDYLYRYTGPQKDSDSKN